MRSVADAQPRLGRRLRSHPCSRPPSAISAYLRPLSGLVPFVPKGAECLASLTGLELKDLLGDALGRSAGTNSRGPAPQVWYGRSAVPV